MKVLTICPSLGRPEMCTAMAESFNRTKELDNTLILGLDVSDSQLIAYEGIPDVKSVLCKAGSTVTKVINDIYRANPGYDYYHITNDDVIYHINGWDTKLANILGCTGGVSYGNDLFQGSNHPTFPFISSNVASSLGWIQEPSLNRYYGDTVWKTVGDQAQCLYYLGGVVIEHKTWFAGKSPHQYDPETYKKDSHAFADWLRRAHLDINKVVEAVHGK